VARGQYEVARIDELPLIASGAEFGVRPVRLHFGITSFGINAYTAENAGDHVIEDHVETTSGAGRHEELYFVVSGRATFEVSGESLDAPAGTLVFVGDPEARRGAVADQAGTTVLVVGATPGRPFEPSPWEAWLAAKPFLDEGRPEEGIGIFEDALDRHPGNPNVLYNLACFEALAGRPEDALTHLQQAVAGDPRTREWAQRDEDFDSIRNDPRFPREG
jgi:Tetratricopeptide repeat